METVTRNACDHAASARFSRILALFKKPQKTSEFVILRDDDEPSENPYAILQKKTRMRPIEDAMYRERAISSAPARVAGSMPLLWSFIVSVRSWHLDCGSRRHA